MGQYTVRYTARTVHVQGAAARAAELGLEHRACGQLTLPPERLATGASADSPNEALAAMRDLLLRRGMKLCKSCGTTLRVVARDERENASRAWTLWGFRDYPSMRTPLPIIAGRLKEVGAEQRRREAEGWTCAIYPRRAEPLGLRQQAAEVFAAR